MYTHTHTHEHRNPEVLYTHTYAHYPHSHSIPVSSFPASVAQLRDSSSVHARNINAERRGIVSMAKFSLALGVLEVEFTSGFKEAKHGDWSLSRTQIAHECNCVVGRETSDPALRGCSKKSWISLEEFVGATWKIQRLASSFFVMFVLFLPLPVIPPGRRKNTTLQPRKTAKPEISERRLVSRCLNSHTRAGDTRPAHHQRVTHAHLISGN